MFWLCLLAIVTSPAWSGQVSAPRQEDLLVPGGTVSLLAAVGVHVPVDRDRALLVAVRALHARQSTTPDEGPIAAVQKHLAVAVQARDASDRVPALLPHTQWEQAVFGEKVGAERLAARILADRKAALLYDGLFALDEETLAFLVGHPSLVSTIYRRDAAVFAAFADAVAVHRGRVDLRSVASWTDRWEAAVGAAASDPEAFFTKLLDRDKGRLAWLFDTISRLDAGRQAFAMGRSVSDLRSLESSFAGFDDGWSVRDSPFTHFLPALDASMILQRVAVTPDGVLAPPNSRKFWEAVFDNRRRSAGLATVPSAGADADRATAPWLIDRFKGTPDSMRRARLDALLFGQRLCAAAAREGVAVDTSSLIETLSAFPEHQTLVVVLERMGFTDARDYAQAIRAATALTARFDPSQQSLRLAMFQGALALVARMREVGTLGASAARELCLSLFPLASSDGSHFPAAVVNWIETALLPASPGGTEAEPAGAEARLIVALAGPPAEQPESAVDWEGGRYRVDLAFGERARLRHILTKLGGTGLDAVLEVGRIMSRIMTPSVSAADAESAGARLLELVPTLVGSGNLTLFGFDRANARDALLARARLLSTGHADRQSVDTRRILAEGLAVALADVLAVRVYAVAIGDPDASLLLGENPARRHDFALGADPPQGPWAVATVGHTGAGSAAAGSLLVLERALGRYWLRRTTLAAPAVRPALWEQIQGFADSVAALRPLDLTDQSRDALVAVLRRGRERIAQAANRPVEIDGLAAAAGVEGWRRRLLRLAATADPTAVSGYFSLGEVLGLGLGASDATEFDAWGPAMRPLDGSLRSRMPLRLEWHETAGHPGLDLISTRIADLHLRVTELLADLKLPAVLAPGIMEYAMWDLAMNAQMASRDDWLAVLRAAQGVSADRVADYVAALTVSGPLVPTGK
jgi:hypothetical protein